MKLKNLLGPYAGLPGNVYVLFLAKVVNSLGNFVWPLLTLLLTDRLGMSKTEAGFFVMLATAAYVPGALIGGKLADHVGRKAVFMSARTLAAGCLVPCAFLGLSPIVPWLLIATCVLNGAADPALTALVADLTRSGERQSAFSLLYLGHNLGFAVGPMVAGLLYQSHLPWLFLGDALTTLVSLALVGALVGETLHQRGESASKHQDVSADERAEEGGLLPALLKRPVLLVFSVVLAVYSLVYVQHYFSLPLQMTEFFGSSGPRLFGQLMSINAITVVLMTAPLTLLTKRSPSTWNIGFGGLLYAVGFGAIYLIESLPLFFLTTVVWTIGEILVTTNSTAFVNNRTPISHRGRFNAVISIISGIGYAVGPLLAGRFIDRYGVKPVWPLSFCFALAAAAVMFCLRDRRRAGSLSSK